MEYTVHQTRRGDYGIQRAGSHIITRDHTGQERRYPTREEAEAALATLLADEAAARQAHEESRARHAAHDQHMQAEAGDLIARQLAWQEWRNAFYARVQEAGRQATYAARKPLSDYAARNPRYAESQRANQDRAIAEAEELRQAYERAVALDAAIKAAYAHGEPVAYAEALAAGEALMQEWGDAPAPASTPASDEKRSAQLLMRLTPGEREQVQTDAAAAGQTVSDYLRSRLGLALR